MDKEGDNRCQAMDSHVKIIIHSKKSYGSALNSFLRKIINNKDYLNSNFTDLNININIILEDKSPQPTYQEYELQKLKAVNASRHQPSCERNVKLIQFYRLLLSQVLI
jgi:recombinational DNA repair protein (RecF pathway)